MELYGLDVSQYQGAVDWRKVRQAGKQFVMIRMGWCGYNGTITWDQRFEENIRGAAEAGLEVGVYLYSYADSAASAQAAARSVLDRLAARRVTYPVALDMEDRMYWSTGKAANTTVAAGFLDTIQAGGYYAMLYTYTSFAITYLDMQKLGSYDLWVADYRSSVGYTGPYGIWQYTGTGKVDGVSTAVDLDVAGKDYADIIRKAGLNHLEDNPQDCAQEVAQLQQLLEEANQRAQLAQQKLEKLLANLRTLAEE